MLRFLTHFTAHGDPPNTPETTRLTLLQLAFPICRVLITLRVIRIRASAADKQIARQPGTHASRLRDQPQSRIRNGGSYMQVSHTHSLDQETRTTPFRSHRPSAPTEELTSIGGTPQPTLVITVQLYPALLKQEWLSEPSESFPSLSTTSMRVAAIGGQARSQGVRYQLPRITLDKYTDVHGLARVPGDETPKVFQSPVLMRLTELILPSIQSPELVPSSFMIHFEQLFCAQVAHIHSDSVRTSSSRGGLAPWQKRRAIDLLSRSCSKDTKLSVVAKECRLSVSHFARSFKVSLGMPVHRWIVEQRVSRAKDLLLTSNEPLIEVAFLAGFSDQASFNRTFAKVMGWSPGRWRKAFKIAY